jgi:cell fate regulator YaaT (PSP1 superfamily)
MKLVYEVWLDAGMRTDCIGDENLHLKKNDWAVIDFEHHKDYCRILTCRGEVPEGVDERSMPKINHRATLHDQSKAHENYIHNKRTQKQATSIVDAYGLGISVVDTHMSFDRKKLTLKFTSPSRVDFRDLVRELARKLQVKVELRQIGVRDVAKMRGGIGTCGRTLCCTSWIHEFQSVNVRMAKDQSLSLNTNGISGQCGRLKCCLNFEHAGYKMISEKMPLAGSRCFVKGAEGRVIDIHLLKESVTVRLKQDGRIVNVMREELNNNSESVAAGGGCGTEGDCGSGGCSV